ncbi:MAG: AraC family transcriptional regulator [Fibrobacteres bacterium]|nr:AraC family transcriptional regulator [Fibrobacterota bacterium]
MVPPDALEKSLEALEEARDYFTGILPSRPVLPTNIILFQRTQASRLGQDLDFHYRFVLIINLRTEGSVVLDNRSFDLRPGEALLVFPHQFHYYHSVRSDSISWLFVTFELNAPESLADLRNRVYPVSGTCGEYLASAIARYAEKAKPAGARESGTILSLVIGLVLVEFMRQDGRKGSMAAPARPSVIDQINRYIWDNFDKDLRLTDLAKKFPYSRSHLRMLFRERMGMSLGTYIQKVRMNSALSRLLGSGLSVSEVAQACGYGSLHAFSRAFKKAIGLSPVAYKKLNADKY